jgi:HD-GYP domain-containing protein (c-di-GMP phosphodiesterase class II)
MKKHVVIGGQIISKAHWLGDARDVVEYHHEKWDGSGYMRGLRGEEIPLSARIFAIVDVFDALTSRRPYKEPLSLEASLVIIQKDAGSHFDPTLVTAFSTIAGDAFQAVQGHSDSQLEQLLATAIEGYYGISTAQGINSPAVAVVNRAVA